MPSLEVRIAEPGDAAALSQVHTDTWVDTYVGRVPDAVATERVATARTRDWSQHAAARVHAGGGVLVLVEQGKVVGFCEFGPTEDADEVDRRVGHIMRLYVHPHQQGRGGGHLLVEAACSRLLEAGYEEVTLWTPEPEWNRGHGFYRRLGWTREDVRNRDLPPDIRYRRRLLDASFVVDDADGAS